MNLQKGAQPDELAALSPAGTVVDFGDELDREGGAFMDTAAIANKLDLVIACDTSLLHLAGGLGVRTWAALQLSSNWRWIVGRTDTPWYPTVRLFRQHQPGDWAGVIAAMAEELKNLAASRR